MPVPKGKQKEYSKIVGHLQNLGIGREAAKDKADRAIKDRKGSKNTKAARRRSRAAKAGY